MKMGYRAISAVLVYALVCSIVMLPAVFCAETKPDGVHNEYNKDGTLQSETTYRDGKKDGPYAIYRYTTQGRQYLNEEGTYKDDKRDGLMKTYYPDGQTLAEAHYKNGVYHGDVKNYHENGQLRSEIVYKNGNPVDGVYEEYWDDGTLRGERSYKDGREDGVQRGYHPNGKLKYESLMIKGKRTDVGKSYDENGRLQGESFSKDGMWTVRKYNEDGTIKDEKSHDATNRYWAKHGYLDMKIE